MTSLPLDPSLNLGLLENGLTFYVKENQKPLNALEIRLVVRIGSLVEVIFDVQRKTTFIDNTLLDWTLKRVAAQYLPSVTSHVLFVWLCVSIKLGGTRARSCPFFGTLSFQRNTVFRSRRPQQAARSMRRPVRTGLEV